MFSAAILCIIFGSVLLIFRRPLGRLGWKQRELYRKHHIPTTRDEAEHYRLTVQAGWGMLLGGVVLVVLGLVS